MVSDSSGCVHTKAITDVASTSTHLRLVSLPRCLLLLLLLALLALAFDPRLDSLGFVLVDVFLQDFPRLLNRFSASEFLLVLLVCPACPTWCESGVTVVLQLVLHCCYTIVTLFL
jgi:hypothetical protein